MLISKAGIAVSLALLVSLQGCGGGGGSTSGATDNSSGTVASSHAASSSQGTLTTSSVADEVTETKPYILNKKLEVFDDYNATTTYSYSDTGAYIAQSHTTRTDGVTIDKRYDYNTTSKVLNVYVKNMIDMMELTQKVTFEDGTATQHLSMDRGDSHYLYTTFDPIQAAGVRAKENVKDIEKELFNTHRYIYTPQAVTIENGYKTALDGAFVLEEHETYSAGDTLGHTFTYSDDNKTVTEMADGVMVRRYVFEMKGE